MAGEKSLRRFVAERVIAASIGLAMGIVGTIVAERRLQKIVRMELSSFGRVLNPKRSWNAPPGHICCWQYVFQFSREGPGLIEKLVVEATVNDVKNVFILETELGELTSTPKLNYRDIQDKSRAPFYRAFYLKDFQKPQALTYRIVVSSTKPIERGTLRPTIRAEPADKQLIIFTGSYSWSEMQGVLAGGLIVVLLIWVLVLRVQLEWSRATTRRIAEVLIGTETEKENAEAIDRRIQKRD